MIKQEICIIFKIQFIRMQEIYLTFIKTWKQSRIWDSKQPQKQPHTHLGWSSFFRNILTFNVWGSKSSRWLSPVCDVATETPDCVRGLKQQQTMRSLREAGGSLYGSNWLIRPTLDKWKSSPVTRLIIFICGQFLLGEKFIKLNQELKTASMSWFMPTIWYLEIWNGPGLLLVCDDNWYLTSHIPLEKSGGWKLSGPDHCNDQPGRRQVPTFCLWWHHNNILCPHLTPPQPPLQVHCRTKLKIYIQCKYVWRQWSVEILWFSGNWLIKSADC